MPDEERERKSTKQLKQRYRRVGYRYRNLQRKVRKTERRVNRNPQGEQARDLLEKRHRAAIRSRGLLERAEDRLDDRGVLKMPRIPKEKPGKPPKKNPPKENPPKPKPKPPKGGHSNPDEPKKGQPPQVPPKKAPPTNPAPKNPTPGRSYISATPVATPAEQQAAALAARRREPVARRGLRTSARLPVAPRKRSVRR